MIFKFTRNWKDDAKGCDHTHLSRRDFIARGMLTGAMTVGLPKLLMATLVKDAMGALPTCPPPVRAKGGISHIYAEGGMTVGAYMINDQQAQIVASSANAANRYGVVGNTMMRLGPNFNISRNSMFGATLLAAGPAMGYTQAAWLALLAKVSLGSHSGPFNQDDGGGANTGLNGGVGPMKQSSLNKDLQIGVNRTLAGFANGLPSSQLPRNPSVAALSSIFSMTPANLTNAGSMTNSANAAHQLAELFGSLFGGSKRTGSDVALANATCGFLGDIPLADPTYGASLFDPARVAALQPLVAGGGLTAAEQAYLSAHYNAASGVVSGVNIQLNGYDYHGQSAANIGARAHEVGRLVALWLAAADKAQAKASLSLVSNGQAIANGVFANTTVNGVTGNVQRATGDAGGSMNAGTILCFDPAGAPPRLISTGAFNTTTGDVRGVMGSTNAMQGLYATALTWVNGTLSDANMKRLGLASAADVKRVSLIG